MPVAVAATGCKAAKRARRPAASSRSEFIAAGYHQRMGAQDTTDAFFELLNADNRDGALKLMEERVEMRIHVGEGVQMLKGVERVGGWFLRADKGLRMIPGEIKDTGHQVECDILVVRPGAKSHKLDATIKVEAGKITSINLSPAKE
jgi:hypothetical protein